MSLFFLIRHSLTLSVFFFFNDTATTEIYTLSLHDALPIWFAAYAYWYLKIYGHGDVRILDGGRQKWMRTSRSEEHTSELQSQSNLVCRLLLEKKKKNKIYMKMNRTKEKKL